MKEQIKENENKREENKRRSIKKLFI